MRISLRKFWDEWAMEMTDFVWRCIRRALFSKTWLAVMSALTIPASVIVPWLIYTHPDWSTAYQIWFNVICFSLIPIGAAVVIIAIRLVVSPFLIYRDLKKSHETAISLLRTKHATELASVNSVLQKQLEKEHARETERGKAVRECFERAAALLKKPTEYQYGREFQGFFKAEPYKLESNKEIVQLCDLLVKAGHKHPFKKIKSHVLESEWLEFLYWGHVHHRLRFAMNPFDYLKGAYEWNHKIKGRPDTQLGLQDAILAELEGTKLLS
jgi:hypothetical protein